MFFQRFFAPRPAVVAGRALFVSASDKARDPAFYEEGGVPDTYEGRFELYALHVILLLHRLKGEGPRMAETRQGLFDAFIRNLDDGLREMGVGDLSVGKKMRKLGAGIYGRLKSYDDALKQADPIAATTPLVRRTVFADIETAAASGLALYVVAARATLAAQSTEHLLQGAAAWPSFPA
jgi:cytochrome b pre-mRNA-processing protein 3